MKKILIENYRGFDIEFDIDSEKFQCICTEEDTKESPSFSAVKRFVDEYKKANQCFNQFYAEPTPGGYGLAKLRIIGIRKDGRFVAENSKGEKVQISDHNLGDYMLAKPENKVWLNELSELREKERKQRLENDKTRKQIISQMNIITLKEYKNSL